jgi:hypothetical protein
VHFGGEAGNFDWNTSLMAGCANWKQVKTTFPKDVVRSISPSSKLATFQKKMRDERIYTRQLWVLPFHAGSPSSSSSSQKSLFEFKADDVA